MTWWGYVERVAATERQRDIAEKTGIDAANISRWKTGQVPRPTFVATFARSYGRPVLEAFVAAGFLTAQEAGEKPAAAPSLADLTDDQLLDEVRARLRRGETGGDTAATTARLSRVPDDVVRGATTDRLTEVDVPEPENGVWIIVPPVEEDLDQLEAAANRRKRKKP